MDASLYQKYRPKKFVDVTGQDLILTALANSIKMNRTSRSYIFAGPHGVGKTSIARLYAKALNCESLEKNDICGKCNNCKLFDWTAPVDVVELDAASNNGVEQIRELIGTTNYVPAQLFKKVYILDEAHMLTTNAWNALLKTLEECPDYNVFILATTEFYKIPLTVLSRCQLYSFQKITDSELEKLLKKIAKCEKFSIEKPACDKLVKLANGSARDLLIMLEQCLSLTNKLSIDTVQKVFGLTDIQTKLKIVEAVKTNNVETISNIIDQLEQKGINFNKLLQDLLNLLIECYIFNETHDEKQVKQIAIEDLKKIDFTNNQLWTIIDDLVNLQGQIRYHADDCFHTKLVLLQIAKKVASKVNNDRNNGSNNSCAEKITVQNCEENDDKNEMKLTEKEHEDIFIAIAYANNKTSCAEDNNHLANFKKTHWVEIDPSLTVLVHSEKVVISSNEGIVVITKTEHEADMINNSCYKNKFASAVAKLFTRPLYVIACTKKQLRYLTEKFKVACEKKIIPTLDISKIKALVKNSMSKYELAKKYFEEELEITEK